MSVLHAPGSFYSEQEAEEYVVACERAFARQVDEVSARLSAMPDLKFIGLSGPTCAGKTTAAGILTDHLVRGGHRVHLISLDNFFREQPDGRRLMEDPDGAKKLDFDSVEALDLPLLTSALDSLVQTGSMSVPRYDLGRGRRQGVETVTEEDASDVFLFEGIQVVYPQVNALLRRYPYHSMAICVGQSLDVGGVTYDPVDIRLMRRLVRDYFFRSSDAQFTFFLWESVRANEQKNILPHLYMCDETLHSLMGYEVGMLRPYLETILGQLPEASVYRPMADRILENISSVQPLMTKWLPASALYREFVPLQ